MHKTRDTYIIIVFSRDGNFANQNNLKKIIKKRLFYVYVIQLFTVGMLVFNQ